MKIAEYKSGVVTYRNMTAEEEAEYHRQQAEEEEAKIHREPTPEERLNSIEQRTDALESTTDDMILLMADLIGGN